MHPEDQKMQREGIAYGRAHAAEFCTQYAEAMRLLIERYADADAEALLSDLRERFWGTNDWRDPEAAAAFLRAVRPAPQDAKEGGRHG